MTAVARTLVAQALQQNSDMVPHLFAARSDNGEVRLTSISTVLALLHDSLSPFETVSIVIDALDECDDSVGLITALMELCAKDNLKIKLTVFSRDTGGIERKLQSAVNVAVTPKDLEADLKSYIESCVVQLRDLLEDEQVLNMTRDKLLSGAVCSWLPI